MRPETTLEYARAQDAADPLRAFRSRFATPAREAGDGGVYLCGHSLGLAPLAARTRVTEELEDWERLAVRGHHAARRPWIGYHETVAAGLAALAGAEPIEVVAMNSLTVNLHLMLASFYRPASGRFRILMEAGAFSSDRHAVASQIAWHGLHPDTALIELRPRAGEELLREEDIEAAIFAAGSSLALVLWPGVQFRTGQAFDLPRITTAAHSVGAKVGFDLAHAIGNVPLELHDCAADFAVWCHYKYLNAGPGAIGGAFVHARHALDPAVARLGGWWGHEASTRFAMQPAFVPQAGAAGWAISNPPILSTAPLLASLEIFADAGLVPLLEKSRGLTAYLELLIRALLPSEVAVITPSQADRRGAQLSVRVAGPAHRGRAVFDALGAAGVVGDFREPDVIRLAPVPLYNGYEDVWRGANALAAAVAASAGGPR